MVRAGEYLMPFVRGQRTGIGRPRKALRAPPGPSSHLRYIEPSPRMRLAAYLYATGAEKTKKDAALAASVDPVYFGMLTNHSIPMNRLINQTKSMIEDETISMSTVLQRLSRKAVGRIADLMDTSENEGIALKAAQDLADRHPETSRTSKIQVDAGLTIGTADAKALAAALVESATISNSLAHIARDGLVEIDTDKIQPMALGPAGSSDHIAQGDDDA